MGGGALRLAGKFYEGLVEAQLRSNDIQGALRYMDAAQKSSASLGEHGASESIRAVLLGAKIHRAAQNLPALREAAARAMKIADETSDRVLQAHTALEAGRACIESDPELALSILERGLVRAREADALAIEALISGDLASIQIRRGFPKDALRLCEEEAEAITKAGLVRAALRNRLRLARCYDQLGDLKASADTLESENVPEGDVSGGAGFLAYRSRIRLAQGRVSSASEDAAASVRLTTRAGGMDFADALLHRGRCALARADAEAAREDIDSAQLALDSSRDVRWPFKDALLALAETELLILVGDLPKALGKSMAAAATFERGSHEVWAATARLLSVRCLLLKDAVAANRLAGAVEVFAIERSLLTLRVRATTFRGLLAQDLAVLDEALVPADRIGSPWILASLSHARYRILAARRGDAAAASEHKIFLSHMSILSADMESRVRANVLNSAERGDHPFLI